MSELDVQHAPARAEELQRILAAYNQVAERLRVSHDRLQSEVARLREELAAKSRELERRKQLAALGQMAAGLAHEIRNPLGGIQLCASMLERDLQHMPRALELARKIGHGVALLESIVRDVLAFANQAEPQLADVPLGEVVRKALLYAADTLERCGCGVEIEDGLDGILVRADPDLLSRALLNLMLNAAQATAGRPGQGVLRIGPLPDDEHLAGVRLADNGCGIPGDVLEKIFHPFFTTRDTGTGLGLAVVHRIIEAHNGRIAVTSRPGTGTEVQCYLPRAGAAAAGRGAPNRPRGPLRIADETDLCRR